MARTHLIKSLRYNMWHSRLLDPLGKEFAGGYTDDILKAGIFETDYAMLYNDEEDNRAVPVAEVSDILYQTAMDMLLRINDITAIVLALK